ncbi:MAG TPA: hypothetical protein VNR67_04300, partial [Solirubrobacterales bacterium]|nr:hypothetical protein [Solirubrobacterales bacterium]
MRTEAVSEVLRLRCAQVASARNFDEKGEDGMKGLKALAAVMLVSGLLMAAVPATAGAAAYKHYVGCGVSQNAKPAHACPKK